MMLFIKRDDAWRLDPISTLEEWIPDLHTTQDIHEAQGEELSVSDGIVDFLAVSPAYFGGNTAGPQITEQRPVGQWSDLDICHLRFYSPRRGFFDE